MHPAGMAHTGSVAGDARLDIHVNPRIKLAACASRATVAHPARGSRAHRRRGVAPAGARDGPGTMPLGRWGRACEREQDGDDGDDVPVMHERDLSPQIRRRDGWGWVSLGPQDALV